MKDRGGRGDRIPYPFVLEPRGTVQYFDQHEVVSISGMIFRNPMVLMMLFMGAHDRLQAAFLTGLRCSRRRRCVQTQESLARLKLLLQSPSPALTLTCTKRVQL